MGVVVKREIALVWLLVMMGIFGICKGFSVYKVGDSSGWSMTGNVDYNKWASSKTFHIGDTLIFEYDKQYHNVLQVSRSDFHSCNPSAPMATYATGNDSIFIRNHGHYYYICGFVSHCIAGQKVDIRVPNSDRAATLPSPSPDQPHNRSTAPNASPDGPLAPGPSESSGEALVFKDQRFFCSVGILLILGWVFN